MGSEANYSSDTIFVPGKTTAMSGQDDLHSLGSTTIVGSGLPASEHSDMPDHDNHDSGKQRRKTKMRDNWWSRAKDFVMKKSKMNDVGQNANFTEQNFTDSGDKYIFRAFDEPYVDWPDARGQTNNHWCSYRLDILVMLLSESDQYQDGHHPIIVTQDSHGSRDEDTQTKIDDVGQNANLTQRNFTASGDKYTFLAESNATHVKQPDARGQTNNHLCSYRLLILVVLLSESGQYGHHPIPVTQDNHGSSDEATQTKINGVGQNFTQHNFTASGEQYIFFAEPNTPHVEQPDTRGQTINHWWLY